jgi:hypothetical protein
MGLVGNDLVAAARASLRVGDASTARGLLETAAPSGEVLEL